MQKKISIVYVLLLSNGLYAQSQSGQYIHKHLMRADASIVSGTMYQSNFRNVHLNGNLEYYLDNKISVRGDVNWMAGTKSLASTSTYLKEYYSVMLGGVYHFKSTSHLDPYFVFQPGIAYVSSYHAGKNYILGEGASAEKTNYKASLAPLGSAGIGFNYYFQQFAHLFAEGRYVYGTHLSQASEPLSLQEIRITFGLGFNLFVAKE